ncbi:MAG: YdcF family protein [Terriglobales bacterium]
MIPEAKPRADGRWVRYLLGLVLIAALAYFLSICAGIVQAAGEDQTHSADAIVVFGAAEYSGRPSPVYRARLDHAFDLFQRGVAPVVITTGGAAADPSFSEGGVGHDYLMGRGIPDASLIAETQGADTAQSAERVAVIMRANHMRSCVAVSDAYHVFRIRKLLQHENVQVFTAPRPESRPHSAWQRAEALLREAASYVLWRLQMTM